LYAIFFAHAASFLSDVTVLIASFIAGSLSISMMRLSKVSSGELASAGDIISNVVVATVIAMNRIVTSFQLVSNCHLLTYVHCNLPVLADPPKAMRA
jgi:hypothetical protein